MTPSERVAYIKGLMEGMKLDTNSDTGKLFAAITDVLSDLATGLEDAEEDITTLYDSSEDVFDSLTELEDYVYGDWEDNTGNGENDGEEEYIAVCPNCSADVPVSPDDLENGSVVCPNCGELLELDFEEEDYDFVYDDNYDDDDDDEDDEDGESDD